MEKTIQEKLSVLSSIAGRLNGASITWAVGASAMLYLRGIVSEFHDLDIMVTVQDALRAKELLQAMGTLHPSVQEARYETKYFFEFLIGGVEVDLIGGFAIRRDGVVHDCGLDPAQITEQVTVNGQEVPLHSLQAWRRYYALMGRDGKVALIDGAL